MFVPDCLNSLKTKITRYDDSSAGLDEQGKPRGKPIAQKRERIAKTNGKLVIPPPLARCNPPIGKSTDLHRAKPTFIKRKRHLRTKRAQVIGILTYPKSLTVIVDHHVKIVRKRCPKDRMKKRDNATDA